MNPLIVIFVLLLSSQHHYISTQCSAEESSCSVEDKQCSQPVQSDGHMYSPSSNNVEKPTWKNYLKYFEDAALKYETATDKLDSKFPYASTIEQDLKVFKKDGIR